jgi:hypothetical protein
MFDGDYSDPMTLFRLPRDMPFAIWLAGDQSARGDCARDLWAGEARALLERVIV